MKFPLILCLLWCIVAETSFAQLNLKDKLSKKANEEIDDFLFGKKKKEKSTAEGDSETYEESSSIESYESSDDEDPLGGYERQSVNYGSLTMSEIVGFRDLINFLPDHFGSYQLFEKPDGATMRYGEFRYSTGSKSYASGEEELKASVFDYLQTGTFLAAYANQYEYESTEGIMKSVEVKGQPGWYSADYTSDETHMVLVVNSRFLVMLSGVGLQENQLREFMETLDVEQLPEAPPVEESEETGEE